MSPTVLAVAAILLFPEAQEKLAIRLSSGHQPIRGEEVWCALYVDFRPTAPKEVEAARRLLGNETARTLVRGWTEKREQLAKDLGRALSLPPNEKAHAALRRFVLEQNYSVDQLCTDLGIPKERAQALLGGFLTAESLRAMKEDAGIRRLYQVHQLKSDDSGTLWIPLSPKDRSVVVARLALRKTAITLVDLPLKGTHALSLTLPPNRTVSLKCEDQEKAPLQGFPLVVRSEWGTPGARCSTLAVTRSDDQGACRVEGAFGDTVILAPAIQGARGNWSSMRKSFKIFGQHTDLGSLAYRIEGFLVRFLCDVNEVDKFREWLARTIYFPRARQEGTESSAGPARLPEWFPPLYQRLKPEYRRPVLKGTWDLKIRVMTRGGEVVPGEGPLDPSGLIAVVPQPGEYRAELATPFDPTDEEGDWPGLTPREREENRAVLREGRARMRGHLLTSLDTKGWSFKVSGRLTEVKLPLRTREKAKEPAVLALFTSESSAATGVKFRYVFKGKSRAAFTIPGFLGPVGIRLAVVPGSHRLTARLTHRGRWVGAQEFLVEAVEGKEVRVSCNVGPRPRPLKFVGKDQKPRMLTDEERKNWFIVLASERAQGERAVSAALLNSVDLNQTLVPPGSDWLIVDRRTGKEVASFEAAQRGDKIAVLVP